IYWVVFAGSTFAVYGLNPFLTTLGLQYNNPGLVSIAGWLTTSDAAVVVGMIMLFASMFQLIAPIKWYTRVQWFLMGSIVLSVVLLVGVLVSVGNAGFIANFNTWCHGFGATGNYYQYVINTANQNGYNPNPGFSITDTIGIGALAWSFLAWAFWSVQNGGEIKSASDLKKQLIIIPGSGIFAAIIYIIIAVTVASVVGQNFMSALAYLSFNQPQTLVTATITPYASFFASIANPALAIPVTFILMIGFLCSSYQINYN